MDAAPRRHIVGVFALQLIVLAGVSLFEASRRMLARRGAVVALGGGATARLGYFLAATIVFYTMAISCVLDIGEVRQRRSTDVIVIFMCVLGAHVWNDRSNDPSATASDETGGS